MYRRVNVSGARDQHSKFLLKRFVKRHENTDHRVEMRCTLRQLHLKIAQALFIHRHHAHISVTLMFFDPMPYGVCLSVAHYPYWLRTPQSRY